MMSLDLKVIIINDKKIPNFNDENVDYYPWKVAHSKIIIIETILRVFFDKESLTLTNFNWIQNSKNLLIQKSVFTDTNYPFLEPPVLSTSI